MELLSSLTVPADLYYFEKSGVSGSSHLPRLPRLPNHFALKLATPIVPPDAKKALEDQKDKGANIVDANKDKVADLAEQYKDGKISEDTFTASIDKQAQDNIKAYTEQELATASNLKKIGQGQSLEVQNSIVLAYKVVSNFFRDLWARVKKFFIDLVNEIVKLWNTVKDWFKNAATTISKWWN